MDFIKSNRAEVERAIRDKGVDLDLDALLALDGEVRGAQDRDRRAARRAQRDQRAVQGRRARGEGRARRARPRRRARARASSKASSASKEAALKALMLRLPGIPWEGAPVGPDESFNTVIRTEGALPELRLRAARPCRADREERLGRPVADHPGVGQPHLLPQGAAGAARDQADGLGAGADRRGRLHPDHRPRDRARAGVPQPGPVPRPPRGNLCSCPTTMLWLAGHRRGRADLAPFGRDHRGATNCRSSTPAIRPASAARRGARARTCAGCCASTSSSRSSNM